VSPVHGDFTAGYPPTLIQGGTREALLSGFVRLYQAIDTQGGTARLDLYEGMVHAFQEIRPYLPESALARKKSAAFLRQYLDR
jgi:acetyl esterase/lipase